MHSNNDDDDDDDDNDGGDDDNDDKSYISLSFFFNSLAKTIGRNLNCLNGTQLWLGDDGLEGLSKRAGYDRCCLSIYGSLIGPSVGLRPKSLHFLEEAAGEHVSDHSTDRLRSRK